MVSTLFTNFISLIFPRYCLACAGSLVQGEETVCTICWSEFPRTDYHLEQENELKKLFHGKLELEYAFANFKFVKSGKIQKLLHKLKYQNKEEVGVFLGRRYGEILKSNPDFQYDIIIPVPLHKSKLKKRGYNQSDAFAEGLSASLGIPWVNNAVIRTVKSETQTKKSRVQRWQNVENVFEVVNIGSLAEKKVLVVDDVITTGATLESCAKEILKQASAVSIAAIAYA